MGKNEEVSVKLSVYLPALTDANNVAEKNCSRPSSPLDGRLPVPERRDETLNHLPLPPAAAGHPAFVRVRRALKGLEVAEQPPEQLGHARLVEGFAGLAALRTDKTQKPHSAEGAEPAFQARGAARAERQT